MSEFELRRRLQELQQERQPQTDLWPAIATRIGAEPRSAAPAPHGRAAGWRWAVAAALSAAVGLGVVAERHHRGELAVARDRAERESASRWVAEQVRSMDGTYQGEMDVLRAGTPAAGSSQRVSPPLYTAAAQLDAAEAQIKHSLAVEPRATYLLEMLGRTQAKRLELEKLKRTT